MSIYIFVILFALIAKQIDANKVLEVDVSFNQELIANLLDSYREFAAAEVVFSKASEEEKTECNKQKKLYADTLTAIFEQKGETMSGYTGVKVEGEDNPLPIVQAEETNCKETINKHFYDQFIKDFVHDNMGKVGGLAHSPEELFNKLKGLEEYHKFQERLEMIQKNSNIQNHLQTAKSAVETTAQQVTDSLFKSINFFKSKANLDDFKSTFHSKAQAVTSAVQGKLQGGSFHENHKE